MRHIDEEAIKAAQDKREEELFIAKYKQFILGCASKHTNKYVTCGDDEWSVAIIAFSEAVKTYAIEKGAFLSFAELVITRRLNDYFRTQAKFIGEISVSPSTFEGQIDECQDPVLQEAVVSQLVCVKDNSIQYEIEAIGALLKEYGFSFTDLVSSSPKAGRTKTGCAAAIRYILSKPVILSEMRRLKALPIKTISLGSGVSPKILERHRKYIIASAEILQGDFPNLSEYLHFVKEETVPLRHFNIEI